MKRPFAFSIALFLCLSLGAQQQRLFRSISVEDGMPHSEVNAIASDPDGLLWMGTYNGIARYDGYSLRVMGNLDDPGKSLRVLTLHHDPVTGTMLIGTEGEGLRVYDLRQGKIRSRHTFANSIYSICTGQDSTLWIGTERGIVKAEVVDDAYRFKYCESTLSRVSDIVQLDPGTLLAASGEGSFLVDVHTGVTTPLLRQYSRALCRVSRGKCLIGTARGLYMWNRNDPGNLRKIDDSDVSCIWISGDSNCWVGTMDAGILRYASDFSSAISYSLRPDSDGMGLPDNGIHTFSEDFSGNLWIGTQNGVAKYDSRAETFKFYNSMLDEVEIHGNTITNKTSTFYEDTKGRLWIGKYHSGLKIFDRGTSELFTISEAQSPNLFHSTISCFFRDRNGKLWIGTWNGLYVMDGKDADRIQTLPSIPLVNMGRNLSMMGTTFFKIVEDKRGHLWFSTDKGLYRYTPEPSDYYSGQLKRYLSPAVTTDIFIEYSPFGEQIMWVGSHHGLYKLTLDSSGTIVSTHASHNSGESGTLCGEFISSIFCDSSDRLWVLGIEGYVNQVTGNRKNSSVPTFRSLNISPDDFSDTAESIQEDDEGMLWIGGVRLTRFNPEDWSLKYYDSGNGLQNRSFKIWSSCRLSSGELVFGGINGFSIFDPLSISQSTDEPRLVLEDISVAGKKIGVGEKLGRHAVLECELNHAEKIRLPHWCNSISITFATLHYTSPDKNQSRYMLEGHDRSWTELRGGNRTASYTRLSPGTYTFRLKGSNCDSVWSSGEKTLTIVVRHPFWACIPAYMVYCMLLSLMAYFIIRTYQQHERSKKEAQIYNMKMKYFADISHEIKTPLSLISAPIAELCDRDDLDSAAKRKLSLVKKNVDRLIDLLEQIIDFNRYESKIMGLRLSEVDLVGLCRVCMSCFEDKAERHDISLSLCADVPVIKLLMDREKIEKTLFNIIGNAFNHTPDGGSIALSCSMDEGKATVCVKDSGSGISPEDMGKVFKRFYTRRADKGGTGIGLALSKAIIEQHKGEIWAESSLGKGAAFYFTLLLGRGHFSEEELANLNVESDAINQLAMRSIDEHADDSELPCVLVVEDNDDMRGYIRDALSGFYRVAIAKDGLSGYEQAGSSDCDCIVSDVMMPVMDGFELCAKIKKNLQTSHIPVLLLTAKDSVEDKIEGSNAGADDYIQKPFEVALLRARIDRLIKRKNEIKSRFQKAVEYSPSMVTLTSMDEQFMADCMRLIEANISDASYNVEQLCKDLGMSRPTVYKKIKSLTGVSVVAFIRSIRLKRAAQLLRQDGSSIKTVMYMVGFDNSSYFSARFKLEFGCTPNEYVESAKSS